MLLSPRRCPRASTDRGTAPAAAPAATIDAGAPPRQLGDGTPPEPALLVAAAACARFVSEVGAVAGKLVAEVGAVAVRLVAEVGAVAVGLVAKLGVQAAARDTSLVADVGVAVVVPWELVAGEVLAASAIEPSSCCASRSDG